MGRGYVLAVASAKGGVGKTTTSTNLATALAGGDGSVLLVEFDLAMANLTDFLDLGSGPAETFHDVLAGTGSVGEAISEAPGGFDVLPSGVSIDGFAKTEIAAAANVVAALRSRYDAVVLDTGAGVSFETLLPLRLADGIVLVTTPRMAAVRDTRKTMDLAARVGGTVIGVVVSRTRGGVGPGAEQVAGFLETPLLGDVPRDDAVPVSQDAGVPVLAYEPESPAAAAYEAAGRQVLAAMRRSIEESDGSPPDHTPASSD